MNIPNLSGNALATFKMIVINPQAQVAIVGITCATVVAIVAIKEAPKYLPFFVKSAPETISGVA